MNSFNLYLSMDKSGYSTNFTAPLNDSRINQDNYEIALAQISFTNTEKIDLRTLHFTSYISPESPPSISDIKFSAKLGESYKNIFEKLNIKIDEIFKKNEFERRRHLRSKNLIKDNEIYYDDIRSGIVHKIILPLKNDNKIDELVRQQIILICPKMSLEYYIDVYKNLQYTLFCKLNSLNHTISFSGNILELIPDLKGKIFNEISGGPQHVKLDSENTPDFSLLFIETDLIENNFFSNEKMKILKYFSTETQEKPQLIDFSSCMEYKQLSYKEANERDLKKNPNPPTSINISFRDKYFKKLSLNQGSILVNLHFRKKL